MILFFILLISVAMLIVLFTLLAPQRLPWYRPHLILNPNEEEMFVLQPVRRQPIIIEGLADPEPERRITSSFNDSVDRLDTILAEKNVLIEKFQKQIVAEKSHRAEFEKVQILLEEEIQKLRNQNKELKIRIGEE